jgi:hypothetical protein
MTDAPETIWWNNAALPHSHTSTVPFAGGTEYRRADLPATDEQALANPKVQALVEALEICRDELDAYSQNEYPSDHPGHMAHRKRDYDANPARAALAAMEK